MTNQVAYYLWLSSMFAGFSGCCLLAAMLIPVAGILMSAGGIVGALAWTTKR